MGANSRLLSKNGEKAVLGASLSVVNTVSSIGEAAWYNALNNTQAPSFDANTQAAIKAALENMQKAETDRVRKLHAPLAETEIDEAYAQLCLTEQIWANVLIPAIPEDFIGSSVVVNLVFSKDDKAALLTRYFRWDLPSLKHIYLPMQAQFIQEFLIDCYKHPEGSHTQKAFAAMDTWQLTMSGLKEIVLGYIQRSAPQDVRTAMRGSLSHRDNMASGNGQGVWSGNSNIAFGSGPQQGALIGSGVPGVLAGELVGGQLLYGNYGSTITDLDGEKTPTVDDSSKSWLSTTLTKLGL